VFKVTCGGAEASAGASGAYEDVSKEEEEEDVASDEIR
jgi:hypothetical protein